MWGESLPACGVWRKTFEAVLFRSGTLVKCKKSEDDPVVLCELGNGAHPGRQQHNQHPAHCAGHVRIWQAAAQVDATRVSGTLLGPSSLERALRFSTKPIPWNRITKRRGSSEGRAIRELGNAKQYRMVQGLWEPCAPRKTSECSTRKQLQRQ